MLNIKNNVNPVPFVLLFVLTTLAMFIVMVLNPHVTSAAASASVQCKNIANASDKTKCQDYVKAYNACDSQKTANGVASCRDKAFQDYLDAVCSYSKNSTRCASGAYNVLYIADIRDGGGKLCDNGGFVSGGCSVCPTGYEMQYQTGSGGITCLAIPTASNAATTSCPAGQTPVYQTGSGVSCVAAASGTANGSIYPAVSTTSLKDNPIMQWLTVAINLLAGVIGLGAIIMVIIAGLQYSAARDNPQAIQAAKTRMANVLIGLAAFIFMYAFLQWLIPGGIF